jgi:hypothetical protein
LIQKHEEDPAGRLQGALEYCKQLLEDPSEYSTLGEARHMAIRGRYEGFDRKRACYDEILAWNRIWPDQPEFKACLKMVDNINARTSAVRAVLSPWEERSAAEKGKVKRMLMNVAMDWRLLHAGEAIPEELFIPREHVREDPDFSYDFDMGDLRNWSIELLEEIESLARLTKRRRDEGVMVLVQGKKALKHNMLTVECVRQAVDGERKTRKMLRAWGVEESDKEEDESEEEVIIADQPETNPHERRQEPPGTNGRTDAPRADGSKKPKSKRKTVTRVGSRNPGLSVAAGDVHPDEGAEEDDEASYEPPAAVTPPPPQTTPQSYDLEAARRQNPRANHPKSGQHPKT